MIKQTFLYFCCFLFGLRASAQTAGEGLSLKGDGSYIVIAVILIILFGLAGYLVSLDRKMSRIEKEMKNKKA